MKSRVCGRKGRAQKNKILEIDSTEFASQKQFFLRFLEFNLAFGCPQRKYFRKNFYTNFFAGHPL